MQLEYPMDQDLKQFACEWLSVAASTLMAVITVAFLSMPLSLGYHPGEAPQGTPAIPRHMT